MGRPVELSVVTVTPDGLEAIERTLAALRTQTASDRIEVVIVGPRKALAEASELNGFAATQCVAVGRIESLGRAIAAGAQAATGPIVAYAEEHSYPEPEWAAALIERHREPWAAVAWALENANPESTTSWAHLLTDFGPGVAPVASGERTAHLPWHHVSYKREELLACGDRLGEMLEAEGMLHRELIARGQRLYLEGTVTSRHLNISRLGSHLWSHFQGGRGFGSARSRLEAWTRSRRLVYVLGSPVVPILRLRRLLRDVGRVQMGSRPRPGLIPLLALSLIIDAIGEAAGYAFGPGRSRERRLTMELERARHLAARDSGWAELSEPAGARAD